MVICLERGADLHTAQLMPLPLTVSCFSKIQIGFTFLVPARLGSPGQRAVKQVCVCVCAYLGYVGRDDYDRGYGGRGYDRDYDDRDRYMSRRGWDDGTPPHSHDLPFTMPPAYLERGCSRGLSST